MSDEKARILARMAQLREAMASKSRTGNTSFRGASRGRGSGSDYRRGGFHGRNSLVSGSGNNARRPKAFGNRSLVVEPPTRRNVEKYSSVPECNAMISECARPATSETDNSSAPTSTLPRQRIGPDTSESRAATSATRGSGGEGGGGHKTWVRVTGAVSGLDSAGSSSRAEDNSCRVSGPSVNYSHSSLTAVASAHSYNRLENRTVAPRRGDALNAKGTTLTKTVPVYARGVGGRVGVRSRTHHRCLVNDQATAQQQQQKQQQQPGTVVQSSSSTAASPPSSSPSSSSSSSVSMFPPPPPVPAPHGGSGLVEVGGVTYVRTSGRAGSRSLVRSSTQPAVGARHDGGGALSASGQLKPSAEQQQQQLKASGGALAAPPVYQKPDQNKKKKKDFCVFFTKFGKCNKGAACRFEHDALKVAVCRRFLQGRCTDTDCPYSHQADRDKMPVCYFFLRGECYQSACPYSHVNVNPSAARCPDFARGFCPRGASCKQKHTLARSPGKEKQGKKQDFDGVSGAVDQARGSDVAPSYDALGGGDKAIVVRAEEKHIREQGQTSVSGGVDPAAASSMTGDGPASRDATAGGTRRSVGAAAGRSSAVAGVRKVDSGFDSQALPPKKKVKAGGGGKDGTGRQLLLRPRFLG